MYADNSMNRSGNGTLPPGYEKRQAAVKVEGLFAEVQAAVKAIGESRGLSMCIGPARFEEKRMVLQVYVMPGRGSYTTPLGEIKEGITRKRKPKVRLSAIGKALDVGFESARKDD